MVAATAQVMVIGASTAIEAAVAGLYAVIGAVVAPSLPNAVSAVNLARGGPQR